jgi:diadenosine tetraphosphatase ApaH/serine/threonine PP2A family protein phosphatase
MIAILSDIHGNLEALQAVLDDARQLNAKSIYCLGDLVGYGPDPCDCLRMSMRWDRVICGDFDNALVRGNAEMPAHLLQMRERLLHRIEREMDGGKMLSFLAACPTSFCTEDALFVHGSPCDHVHDYLFPECIYSTAKLDSVFAGFDKLCFGGHTHIAGLFVQCPALGWDYKAPADCEYKYAVRGQKLFCNVGSVGQPRDEDPRASYVLFDGETIVFRRVNYDIEKTIMKIRKHGDDDMHGMRLHSGR